jgi:hypothetical protein
LKKRVSPQAGRVYAGKGRMIKMEMKEAVEMAGRSMGKYIAPCGFEERVFMDGKKEIIVNNLFFTVHYTDAGFTQYRMHTFINGKEASGIVLN